MKKRMILFLAVCLVLCLIPSVGMLFFPTTESSENRRLAEAPEFITEDGKFNTLFFNDFQSYFNDHIALRNPLVYADAKIQTTLFSESNVDGVVYGKNDWLYYSSTLDDYLGRKVLSERELYNLAHNFSIIQDYFTENNIDFVLTIPPNKNTLYGENMPYYYSHIVNSEHSAKLLKPFLEKNKVKYTDLFELFENQEETLYLLRDSHWNMKGACLAYNALMNSLNLEHQTYSEVTPTVKTNENGDLNKMLYSFYGKPEKNFDYNISQEYKFTTNSDNVEDGWLITENQNATGSLLMFRDSFANTLIPFFSNEFRNAYYSKGQPNAIERYVSTYAPDKVVIEIVERNITNYLNNPPILSPATTEISDSITVAETDSSIKIEACMYDANYYTLSGIIDAEHISTSSEILVKVGDIVYRPYQTETNGFLLYLSKEALIDSEYPVEVYISDKNSTLTALSETLTIPQ